MQSDIHTLIKSSEEYLHMRKSKTKLIVGIIIVSVVAGIAGYAYGNQDLTMFIPNQKPKEPIAVYNNCEIDWLPESEQVFDWTVPRTAYMHVYCDVNGTEREFRLNPPYELEDTKLLFARGNLYQYSEIEFEVGINDGVSEKRYSTTRWELP